LPLVIPTPRRLHSILESLEPPLAGAGSTARGTLDGDAYNTLNASREDSAEVDGYEYEGGYALDLGAGSSGCASPSSLSSRGSPAPGYAYSYPHSYPYSYSSSSSSEYESARHRDGTSSVGTSPEIVQRAVESKEIVMQRTRAQRRSTISGPSPAVAERMAREWAVAICKTPPIPSSSSASNYAIPYNVASRGAGRARGNTFSGIPTPPIAGRNAMVRSAPTQGAGRRRRDEADRDCGICFEYAVKPARTKCCGKVFCGEHLEDVSSFFVF